jgi:cellulose synthase/poly-beta-1,6-N-acetylglucosamine synthase-like glycosyltransferase
MIVVVILFWVSLSVMVFCYIGYGLLLYTLNAVKKLFKSPVANAAKAGNKYNRLDHPSEWPPVTLIIAAYNEGLDLKQKLQNTLDIDYPTEQLRVIFVTDGTTDGSHKIIDEHIGITLLHEEKREGKLAAITRAMKLVDTPFVIFSDANAMLNRECIKRMIAHYYNNPKTGGVAGEKKIISREKQSAIGEAEGLYWQYESFMKKQDAGFNTVVGAAGELYSIRTKLFQAPAHDLILDDFIISMQVCLKGYKIEYEPGAFATELPSASLKEEMKRKVRISAGAYQSIGYLSAALNFFKHPLLCFQYISRRLLRWVCCPWMLIILFVTNILILTDHKASGIYSLFLFAQIFFYMIALAGGYLLRSGNAVGIFAVPFYFLFMNFCLVKGFIRFLKKKQPVQWERSLREAEG